MKIFMLGAHGVRADLFNKMWNRLRVDLLFTLNRRKNIKWKKRIRNIPIWIDQPASQSRNVKSVLFVSNTKMEGDTQNAMVAKTNIQNSSHKLWCFLHSIWSLFLFFSSFMAQWYILNTHWSITPNESFVHERDAHIMDY